MLLSKGLDCSSRTAIVKTGNSVCAAFRDGRSLAIIVQAVHNNDVREVRPPAACRPGSSQKFVEQIVQSALAVVGVRLGTDEP
jgi:Protein of unknown function (DUF732)